jgi:hypothetical protein
LIHSTKITRPEPSVGSEGGLGCRRIASIAREHAVTAGVNLANTQSIGLRDAQFYSGERAAHRPWPRLPPSIETQDRRCLGQPVTRQYLPTQSIKAVFYIESKSGPSANHELEFRPKLLAQAPEQETSDRQLQAASCQLRHLQQKTK